MKPAKQSSVKIDQFSGTQPHLGKKAYVTPVLLQELALETRAGSTFSVDPNGAELDFLNLFTGKEN